MIAFSPSHRIIPHPLTPYVLSTLSTVADWSAIKFRTMVSHVTHHCYHHGNSQYNMVLYLLCVLLYLTTVSWPFYYPTHYTIHSLTQRFVNILCSFPQIASPDKWVHDFLHVLRVTLDPAGLGLYCDFWTH